MRARHHLDTYPDTHSDRYLYPDCYLYVDCSFHANCRPAALWG
jgi:hypothetical protein